MFVDLVFKFCCSKRQKNGSESLQKQPVKSEETTEQNQNYTFTTYIDTQRTNSYNEAISNHDQNGNNKMVVEQNLSPKFNRAKLATSIENQFQHVDEPDNYLLLGDSVLPVLGSFECIKSIEKFWKNTEFNVTQNVMQNGQVSVLKRSASTQTFETKELLSVKKRISKDNGLDKQIRNIKIWEPTEDQLLKKYYEDTHGNWKQIAQMIPGRNMNQCAQRWRRLNPQKNYKQKWTLEDDQRIIGVVNKQGKNWMEMSKMFPGRSGKQIRERYLNKLDPQLRLGGWLKEEDQVILDTWTTEGPKWTLIASKLSGRSENMVKNRFHSHIKRVVLGQQSDQQVVLQPLNYAQNSSEQNNTPTNRVNPYSENGSYSSGSLTNYSYFDSIEGEDEIQFLEDSGFDQQNLDDQFLKQCDMNGAIENHKFYM